MEYKGGHWKVHEQCIVHTEKAPLKPKRCHTVKKAKPAALAIAEL